MIPLAVTIRTLLLTLLSLFLFNDTTTTEIYTLSLHDALPISKLQLHRQQLRRHHRARTICRPNRHRRLAQKSAARPIARRSEEHTSELQSRRDLVCRLLLEKKKDINIYSL